MSGDATVDQCIEWIYKYNMFHQQIKTPKRTYKAKTQKLRKSCENTYNQNEKSNLGAFQFWCITEIIFKKFRILNVIHLIHVSSKSYCESDHVKADLECLVVIVVGNFIIHALRSFYNNNRADLSMAERFAICMAD
jgi:hypothetical protein